MKNDAAFVGMLGVVRARLLSWSSRSGYGGLEDSSCSLRLLVDVESRLGRGKSTLLRSLAVLSRLEVELEEDTLVLRLLQRD